MCRRTQLQLAFLVQSVVCREVAYHTQLRYLLSIVQILEGTVATACREMDALHRLINGIALLDVLQSFATVVG